MLPNYVTTNYLSHLVLIEGCGSGREGDRCAMQELRSWLDLDPCSDAIPDCVSLVIGSFVIGIQDARPEWRAQIPPILPLLISSKGDDALERRRMFRCADWAVRTCLFSLLPDEEDLQGLLPIVDEETALRAAVVCNKIYQTVVAHDDAARAVAAAWVRSAAAEATAVIRAAVAELRRVGAVAATAAGAVMAAHNNNAHQTSGTNNIDPISFLKELLSMS